MAGSVLHYGLVRLRVNGTGSLQLTLIGYDNVQQSVLVPLDMSANPGWELDRLANFKNQKARLRLSTSEIDEVMAINNIIIYVKPMWSQYPG